MRRQRPSHPLHRLGRWNGTTFEPVAPGSVQGGNLRVMSHGWAPGLGPVVDAADGFLRVWDEEATTADGARFDRWYGPLAEAIQAHDPTSTVLGYTWIDQSATTSSNLRGAQSQLRTNSAGFAFAHAVQAAMGDSKPTLHLIGHSHGAKVVTVAATLMPEPPAQVTLFDSPENLLPVLGGALNDLSTYLRALPIGPDATFVDNYPSQYGIRYGRDPGLGEVVDVALDPTRFPIDEETNQHSYAWLWYIESAKDVSRNVGFAWSPLNPGPSVPYEHQLQHPDDGDEADPLTLEPATAIERGRNLAEAIGERASRSGRFTITTEQPVRRGLYWRQPGDQTVSLMVRWLEGPPDASVALKLNQAERWRSTRGWYEVETRQTAMPVAGIRAGLGSYELRLDSPESAAVEITPGDVRALPVPALVEYRSWLRPLGMLVLVALPALVAQLLRWRLR